MNFYAYDGLFVGVVVCLVAFAYAVMRADKHEQNRQAIAAEIDRGPDPYLEPAARFSLDADVSPRDVAISLGAFQEHAPLKPRHLRLVGDDEPGYAFTFSKRTH